MNLFEKQEAFDMDEVFEFLDQHFRKEKLDVYDQVFIHDKQRMGIPFLHVGKYFSESEGRLLGTFLKRIKNKDVDVRKGAKLCSNFYPESKPHIVENQFEKYLP